MENEGRCSNDRNYCGSIETTAEAIMEEKPSIGNMKRHANRSIALFFNNFEFYDRNLSVINYDDISFMQSIVE